MKKDKAISYILFDPVFKTNEGKQSCLYRDYMIIERIKMVQSTANCALWRLDRLKRYCRPGESAWGFEVNSKKRRGLFDKVYTYKNGISPVNVNIHKFSGYGVSEGKWCYKTLDLFHNYGIEVDLSQRGVLTKEELDAKARAYRSMVKERKAQPFRKRVQMKMEAYKDAMPDEMREFLREIKHFKKIK
jgi:hypothetical protein